MVMVALPSALSVAVKTVPPLGAVRVSVELFALPEALTAAQSEANTLATELLMVEALVLKAVPVKGGVLVLTFVRVYAIHQVWETPVPKVAVTEPVPAGGFIR